MNILNGWKILELLTPQGETLVCIEGRVYGSNPRFPSSSQIRTSPVIAYRFENTSLVVTTKRGSEYALGKPHSSQAFAQRRLIRRIDQLGKQPPSTFNALESHLTEVPAFLDILKEDVVREASGEPQATATAEKQATN